MKRIFFAILLIQVVSFGQSFKIYEAESASLKNAAVENEHAGFSGSGYVNFDNQAGSSLEWNIFMADTDSARIVFRFANGSQDNRKMSCYLDDTLVTVLDFIPTGAWTNWDSVNTKLSLVSGRNRLKIVSAVSSGGPNIDFVKIYGEPGIVKYSLQISGQGGSVLVDPDSALYLPGSIVKVTAMPEEHYSFIEWNGDLSGSDNPAQINMDSDKRINAIFRFNIDTTITDYDAAPFGFASLAGGTTGGAGGTSHFVKSGDELYNLIHPRENKDNSPMIIYIDGLVSGYNDMIDIKRTANISVLGVGKNAEIRGFGFKLVQASNIVIRNLKIADAKVDEKDGLTVDGSSNVWIDHCTFTDSPSIDPNRNNHDGLLDIKRGSFNVTVSNCYFTNHRTVALLGHSGSETGDVNLKVTYLQNWFDGTNSRHPRIRYGKVHIVNNYYSNIKDYGIGATYSCQAYVESNYFENTPLPILISKVNDPGETLSGDPAGFVKAVDNFLLNSGDIVENNRGFDFNPSDYYTYQPAAGSKVKELVQKNAGAGKLQIITSVKSRNFEVEPENFILYQNYPNPFNPSTNVKFRLPATSTEGAFVKLSIYNSLGEEVSVLFSGYTTPDEHEVHFNADNLPSGVYFYRLQSGNYSIVRKMMLLR